jgi:tubulin monoglycylase TTLL3/8
LCTKDIPYTQIQKEQIVNHFQNNIEITKKSGLYKNLKNMILSEYIDIDYFFPRCFEMSERTDFEDFLEDFKCSKALSLLKQFNSKTFLKQITEEQIISCIETWEKKLELLSMVEKLKDSETKLDYLRPQSKLMTVKEWVKIGEEDIIKYSKEVEKLEKMNKIGFITTQKRSSSTSSKDIKKSKFHLKEIQENGKTLTLIKKQLKEDNNGQSLNKYYPIVSSLLERVQKIYPQSSLTGENNIWILKPCGLSRGRGITPINDLNEILLFIKKNSNQYLIQKYIEHPLLILGRKVYFHYLYHL